MKRYPKQVRNRSITWYLKKERYGFMSCLVSEARGNKVYDMLYEARANKSITWYLKQESVRYLSMTRYLKQQGNRYMK